MANPELVQRIKNHAKNNYDKGWDTIVECYSDAEIDTALDAGDFEGRPIRSFAQAVRHFQQLVGLYSEQTDNVMCQSGEHEKCPHCGRWVYIDDLPCKCTTA